MKSRRSALLFLLLCCCGWSTWTFAVQPSPVVVTYQTGGNQSIYCFAGGDNGHLVVNHFDGFIWQWSDWGLPAGASRINGQSISAVAATDAQGSTLLYVFAVADNGHLVLNISGRWYDHGVPSGNTTVGGNPPSTAAITYLNAQGTRRVYAFVQGDDNGHLFTNYFDGVNWNWADQGFPSGGPYFNHLTAITYLSARAQRQIYVFAEPSSSLGLVANYWNGFSWHWTDQGSPQGTNGVSLPTAITYLDSAGIQRIYVFADGWYSSDSSQHLVVNYWDGHQWYWADQGKSDSDSLVTNAPTAITYVDAAAARRIYAFAMGNKTSGWTVTTGLYLNYWDGAGWHWNDQGDPPGQNLLAGADSNTSAITFLDAAARQEIYCFAVEIYTNHLVVNYWNGSKWLWSDHGTM